MKKTTFLTFTLFLLINNTNAQVLYNENFDNYISGNLGTDPDGAVPGKGGWLTKSWHTKTNSAFTIVDETGRGKVFNITCPISKIESYLALKPNLNTLIDKRTTGNDVIKFEIDYYTGSKTTTGTSMTNYIAIEPQGVDLLHGPRDPLIHFAFSKADGRINIYDYAEPILSYTAYYLPFNTWISLIVYLDYTNRKVYFEIPFLNKVFVSDFLKAQNSTALIQDFKPYAIELSMGFNDNNSYNNNRYDNIKLTALKNVPSEVITLTTDQQLAQKFNLYPNPATNIVNITNNEQMRIKEIEIYDTAGKLIDTQTFNDQTQIQLNISALSSGTYLLHLKTDEGIAVKKLVKN